MGDGRAPALKRSTTSTSPVGTSTSSRGSPSFMEVNYGPFFQDMKRKVRKVRRREGTVTIDFPEHIDWSFERVLTSTRYHVSRHELETQWSFEDLCIANDTIDLLDDAEHRSAEEARRKAASERER
jgi:hypothetical protein